MIQPVVVEIKEHQPAGHFQVVNPLDEVVLEAAGDGDDD